jgi:hypothetical protein
MPPLAEGPGAGVPVLGEEEPGGENGALGHDVFGDPLGRRDAGFAEKAHQSFDAEIAADQLTQGGRGNAAHRRQAQLS